VGWAVQESPDQLERRRHRTERAQGRNIPKLVFLGALVLWNVLGLGLLLLAIFGNTNEPTGTRDVVFNVVFWTLLVGDLVLVAVGFIGRRFLQQRGS
jgi:hypothetical protein